MKSVGEWSQAFDLLWNNIFSDKAPGLEEYEKSMFLTIAQGELVKDAFSPRTNPVGEGYDDSIRRQADFLSLVDTAAPTAIVSTPAAAFNVRTGTRYYRYPDAAFLVLNEELTVNGGTVTVVPISYDEYARLMMRPYKYPPKGQVWRLITHTVNTTENSSPVSYQVIELVGKFKADDTVSYRMRFVQRPHPIILEALTGGLSIEGETAAATCALPEHLHNEILVRAVNLAKIAWEDTAAPQGQQKQ